MRQEGRVVLNFVDFQKCAEQQGAGIAGYYADFDRRVIMRQAQFDSLTVFAADMALRFLALWNLPNLSMVSKCET